MENRHSSRSGVGRAEGTKGSGTHHQGSSEDSRSKARSFLRVSLHPFEGIPDPALSHASTGGQEYPTFQGMALQPIATHPLTALGRGLWGHRCAPPHSRLVSVLLFWSSSVFFSKHPNYFHPTTAAFTVCPHSHASPPCAPLPPCITCSPPVPPNFLTFFFL